MNISHKFQILKVFKRSLANISLQSKLVECPKVVSGINGKYAHALYSASFKEKELESVEKSIREIEKIMNENQRILQFVNNPSNTKDERLDVMKKVAEEVTCPKTLNSFIDVVGNNGRFSNFSAMFSVFNGILSAHRGEITVCVTSAKELDANEMNQLNSALAGFLKKGCVVKIVKKIDKSIIGGLIINIGEDKYIDLSTKRKLMEYENVMKDSVL